MVQAAYEDGFSGKVFESATLVRYSTGILPLTFENSIGDHDVPPSIANSKLDGQGYRASSKRGIHMAKSVSWVQCAS